MGLFKRLLRYRREREGGKSLRKAVMKCFESKVSTVTDIKTKYGNRVSPTQERLNRRFIHVKNHYFQNVEHRHYTRA